MKRALFLITPILVIICSYLMILNRMFDFAMDNLHKFNDQFGGDVDAFVQYLDDNIPYVKAQRNIYDTILEVAAVAQVVTIWLYAVGKLKRDGFPRTEFAVSIAAIYCSYGVLCYEVTPILRLVTEWVTQSSLAGVGIFAFVFVTYKVMM